MENLSGREAALCPRMEHRARNGHEESGRDALAGYVGNDEYEMVVIECEEIVQVTAYLIGRIHESCQVQLSGPAVIDQRGRRQQRGLQAHGEAELRLHAFLFGQGFLQGDYVAVKILQHLIKGIGQSLKLVSGMDGKQCLARQELLMIVLGELHSLLCYLCQRMDKMLFCVPEKIKEDRKDEMDEIKEVGI